MIYNYDENTNISNPKIEITSFCSKWDKYEIRQDNGIYFIYGYLDKKDNFHQLYSSQNYNSPEILFRLIKLFRELEITKNPLKNVIHINLNITTKDLNLIIKFCKQNGMPFWGNGENDVFRNDDYLFNKSQQNMSSKKQHTLPEEIILREVIPLSSKNCFCVATFIWYLRVLFNDFKNVVAYCNLEDDPNCILLLNSKDKQSIEKIKSTQKEDGFCHLQSPYYNPFITYWSDENMQLEVRTDNPMHLSSYYLCLILSSRSMCGYIRFCKKCGSLFVASNSRQKYCYNPCSKQAAYASRKRKIHS